MSKIATLELIAESLGVTEQLVSRDMVIPGFLVKNEKGRIDIADMVNREFLNSKGCDWSVFYPKSKNKKKSKKVREREKDQEELSRKVDLEVKPSIEYSEPKQIKKEKDIEIDSLDDDLPGANSVQKLDIATRIEKLKGIKKDNALKDLKLTEEKGRLIDKSLVQNLVFDTIGTISQAVLTLPHSLVDELISIAQEKEGAREKILKLLIERYGLEMRKSIEETHKKFEELT